MGIEHQLTIIVMCTLSLVSYNSQGHGIGRIEYLNKLVNNVDFVLLQEQWYFEDEIASLSNVLQNTIVHGKSQMSSNDIHEGRPFGGCALIWKSSFKYPVIPIETESNRLCIIKCQIGSISLLVCNVYMPCDTTTDVNNRIEYMYSA